MYELDALGKFILTTLTADDEIIATGIASRVFQDQAPDKVSYPFILFNFQSGADANGLGIVRVLSSLVYQIKIITQGPPKDADRVAAYRIDRLFQTVKNSQQELTRHDAAGDQTETIVISSRRESPVKYIENDQQSKTVFHHRGGLFRFDVHSLTTEC